MHIPVLQKEIIERLDPKFGGKYIDATLGFGGHAKLVLEKTKGKLLGIEKDPEVARITKSKNIAGLKIVNSSFVNLKEIAEKNGFMQANGILFDLGFSSWHIERSGRGFTFQKDEPLDMRFNPNQELTASEIVNSYSEQDIEKILRDYGQEAFANRIARAIVRKRPIQTSLKLAQIIEQAIHFRSKIHPATKTFQALRIVVNNELSEIEQGLNQATEVLGDNGRLAVISFHSLEDKIVKNFFKRHKDILKTLTKKPIIPQDQEIKENPKARSAKLRVAEKIWFKK